MRSSGTGGPFLARVGSFGSPCAAHTHTRARARACTRPRCTLQHTFPLHCTSTTTAHLCTCALTCALRSGASGRGGLYGARHGWATPTLRHRGPLRGLQPPQQEASRRFAMELQLVYKSAAGPGPSSCSERHASIRPQRPRMPGRSMRACASAARERAAQQLSEDATCPTRSRTALPEGSPSQPFCRALHDAPHKARAPLESPAFITSIC